MLIFQELGLLSLVGCIIDYIVFDSSNCIADCIVLITCIAGRICA